MTVGQRIKSLREQNGITQTALADAISTTKQNIYKYETGVITNIPRKKIEAIAHVLNTTPAQLMGWDISGAKDVFDVDGVIPVPNTVSVPLIGTIACGTPITAVENTESYVETPNFINADFALRCKGDSMIDARINHGDIVYIHIQPTVNNGEIAAVLIDEEATLKRVYLSENTLTLIPCNSKYQPFVYTGNELEKVRILGKAMGFSSNL